MMAPLVCYERVGPHQSDDSLRLMRLSDLQLSCCGPDSYYWCIESPVAFLRTQDPCKNAAPINYTLATEGLACPPGASAKPVLNHRLVGVRFTLIRPSTLACSLLFRFSPANPPIPSFSFPALWRIFPDHRPGGSWWKEGVNDDDSRA